MISDYEYAEYFRDHNIVKDMIIVDKGATVTKVADSAPTISGETYLFTTGDIKSESFSLDEAICEEDNIRFGLLSSSQVSVTVAENVDYPNLEEEIFNVYIYFNGDSFTLFQIGQYRVESDSYTEDRRFRQLKMFDWLHYLRDYDITSWYNETYLDNGNQPIRISTLANGLFHWLLTEELIPLEAETLSQMDYTIGKTIQADDITFGYFMERILEAMGCFGHIDRTGQFVYKYLEWYDAPAAVTITDLWRKPPTSYNDGYTWGIGKIHVYDANNKRIFEAGSTNRKHPSIYTIADSFVFGGKAPNDTATQGLLDNLWNNITHIRYKTYDVECIGDLCVEVGDRIDVQFTSKSGRTKTFYTYVLERHLTGIQSMRDNYAARGDKKQPRYKIEKGSSYDTESGSGIGTGGVSFPETTLIDDFYELIRNIGFRALDKPSDVVCEHDSANGVVKISWTDPDNISTTKPVTATWAGTIVVRKENEMFRNIWDGEPDVTTIVNETTKNTYSQTYLTDNTIEDNKQYYYAIFPYDTKGDYGQPVIISVNTNKEILAPTITSIEMGGSASWDGSEVAILYSGDTNSLTVQISNSHIVFKLYSGNTEIYSFTSPVGSGVSDVDKIHVSFLKDDTNLKAKPSFIYETANGVYSYNQESPTDAQMGLIYVWLNLG